MKSLWLLFVVGAALAWGAYVPTIHHGQLSLGGPNRAMRAFLFVGLAYFLAAVIVPGVWLVASPDHVPFTRSGVKLATAAGLLGAAGALCVIFALKFGGKPFYVAPLVFGGAPLINVLISWYWDRPHNPPHALFYLGILLLAAGVFLVLRYKPDDGPAKHSAAPALVSHQAQSR